MNPPLTLFAIGTTLANLANVEVNYLTRDLLNVPPDGRVPLVGSVGRRVNGVLKRDGFKNGLWVLDVTEQEAFNAFLLSRFVSYTRDSIPQYVSTIDESGHYSPFLVQFERPSTVDGTATPSKGGDHLTPAIFTLSDCIIQTVTKTGNYTVTTADKFIYCDTSGGNITLALPAVSGVNPYVVFSAVKTSGSNSLVLDGNGGELVGGATTLTRTALNARVDYYTDGTQWLVI